MTSITNFITNSTAHSTVGSKRGYSLNSMNILLVAALLFVTMLLTILSAGFVSAAPPVPPSFIPDKESIIQEPLALAIDVDSMVNMSFKMVYSHNTDNLLNCMVSLDGDYDNGLLATVYPGYEQEESFNDVELGAHTLNVTCTDGDITITAIRQLTVVDMTGVYIVILSPSYGSTINSTSRISYRHSSSKSLSCNLSINGTDTIKNSNFVGTKLVTATMTNGSHVMNVTCWNATRKYVSSNVEFTVVNQTSATHGSGVYILSPPDPSPVKVNVTFYHKGPGEANCIVYLNKAKVRGPDAVDVNVNKTYILSSVSEGTKNLNISCSDGAWTGSASKSFVVSEDVAQASELLHITPRIIYPGGAVSIAGEFQAYTTIEVEVSPPSGKSTIFEVDIEDGFDTHYSLGLGARTGIYKVKATDIFNDSDTKNGTFEVKAPSPAIWLSGNTTNITENKYLTIYGKGFLSEDNVTLLLVGGGSSITNKVTTDDSGTFEFTFKDRLSPKSYTITASSVSVSTVKTTLSFVVSPQAAGCYDGKKNGDEEDVDCGGSCLKDCAIDTGADSSSGDSANGSDDSSNGADDKGGVEQPDLGAGRDDDILSPDSQQVDSQDDLNVNSGFNWMLVILPIAIIGLLGLAGGFLVYNGTLDISSVEAFQQSFHDMIGGRKTRFAGSSFENPPARSPIGSGESQRIKEFISAERARGFDDLTIRAALIAKGWQKDDVDSVFDELYKS